MKNVSYTLTETEKTDLKLMVQSIYQKMRSFYLEKSDASQQSAVASLEPMWLETAKAAAIFKQLEKDGIAEIAKKRDDNITFTDYLQINNSEKFDEHQLIEEIETEYRRQLANFNREGVWTYSLVIFGEEVDALGGFSGMHFIKARTTFRFTLRPSNNLKACTQNIT